MGKMMEAMKTNEREQIIQETLDELAGLLLQGEHLSIFARFALTNLPLAIIALLGIPVVEDGAAVVRILAERMSGE